MKNKDIAREVKTTEQVVKNYLRKIYDKLNVADRLELALYSMHHRLLDGYVFPSSEMAGAKATRKRTSPPVKPAAAAGRGDSERPAAAAIGRSDRTAREQKLS